MAPPSSPSGPSGPGSGPTSGPPTPEQMMMMMAMPMAPPPPGVIANLENPESRVDMAVGICASIMGVMLFFVSLRFYIKGVVTKSIGLEDWACLLAAILNIGYGVVIFLALEGGGLGVHIWEVRMGDIMNKGYFQRLIATQSLYPIALFFTKLSILLLVYRIFKANKIARYLTWFGIAVNALFYGATFVLTVVWCAPAPGGDPMISAGGASCQEDAKLLSIIQAGFSIGSDLYLLLIPLPLVARLKTTLAKRIRIGIIFALGLLATILSALTLYYRVLSLRTIDISWVYIPVIICSIYELNIGVICACLPCLPALFKTDKMQAFFSIRTWSLFSSRSGSGSGSTSNLFKASKDSHKRSEYSDIEKLRSGEGSTKGSVTVHSIELQQSPLQSPRF